MTRQRRKLRADVWDVIASVSMGETSVDVAADSVVALLESRDSDGTATAALCEDNVRELIERQFARLEEVEDVLANGAIFADEPCCHPLYPHAVAARQILQREFATATSHIEMLTEALEMSDAHIRLMQRDVLAYLPPDSTMSEHDLVSVLIERLDGPEQRAVQAKTSTALNGQSK